MSRTFKLLFSAILLSAVFSVAARAQATYTAASCNESDVNAVINGPTHTAVNGDTIAIPAGSCIWATGITVPRGIGISIVGYGTPSAGASTTGASPSCSNTTLIDALTAGPMFRMSPNYGNATSRISCIHFVPLLPSTGFSVPVLVVGTCTAAGCPSLRLDNLTVPGTFAGLRIPDDTFAAVVDMFGVADHDTVGGPTLLDNGVDFINISYPSWQGVGFWGDNSWASPDTFGTAQAFYLENNSFDNAFGTDTDGGDTYADTGGGRFVCRFNTFDNATTASSCTNHGTETTGRPRGGRQMEAYGNTLSCSNTRTGCPAGFGLRSGVGIVFGNSFSADPGSWFNNYLGLSTQRTYRPTLWLACDGTGPYDDNDGQATVYTGKIASTGANTISVSGAPWPTGAFNFSPASPGGKYYVVFDETTGDEAGIQSNTSSTLALSWMFDQHSSIRRFAPGDSIEVFGVTLYAAGTMTGTSGSPTLTDSTKRWVANQWVDSGDAYSVLNVTQGTWYQIGTSTPDALSAYVQPFPMWYWNYGDQYVILRASRCFDQPSSSGGMLRSGNLPAPAATTETNDPSYEFDNHGYKPAHGNVNSDSLDVVANRNYYAASPDFDGSSGTGYGTLANRPASCTPRVGYWATDQGSWNQSGNGFGQGELYVCTAPNTWTLYYTPFVYPHPLDASKANSAPDPPTHLSATVK